MKGINIAAAAIIYIFEIMDDICRLCCSVNFVNNYIFDEENALFLKMSLYLPIKVLKNDRLPQRICDKCSCKVNDFYQFCNETIEVQKRLRAALLSSAHPEDSVDLTRIKHNSVSPTFLAPTKTEPPEAYTYSSDPAKCALFSKHKQTCEQTTQTDSEVLTELSTNNDANVPLPLYQDVKIKDEPKTPTSPVKLEEDYEISFEAADSDEDVSLRDYQRRKKAKKMNGSVKKKRKGNNKLGDWEMLMRALPGAARAALSDSQAVQVKTEHEERAEVKSEPVEYHCCVCLVQCYSRAEMLKHYKEHAASVQDASPPAPPAPPAARPLKCARCSKVLEESEWSSHWARHWERDRRPYRCALCEKTFRDHHQILKHGLTHKPGDALDAKHAESSSPRFACDLCPQSFVYMRYLLAHRTRDHPESLDRALALRCAVCARQFAHLNSLRRHLRAHSGERNHLCSVCGKALSSREHLKFHLRIHTGYKPNVCKVCGKGFVKKCNLTLHERVHSGEKPHVCAHCGKAFSQRSTLVIHERYHSGARPYVCSLCHRGFVAKGLLSMHLKTTCI